MLIFWNYTPCSLLETDYHFRAVYCLHYQGSEQSDGGGGSTSEMLVSMRLHNATSQKIVGFTFVALRT